MSRSVRCSRGALKNDAQESGVDSARKIAFYIERGFSKLTFKRRPWGRKERAMCVSQGRRGMGQRGSKCRDHEAACAVGSDDSREAGAAGGWLDCRCSKTLL